MTALLLVLVALPNHQVITNGLWAARSECGAFDLQGQTWDLDGTVTLYGCTTLRNGTLRRACQPSATFISGGTGAGSEWVTDPPGLTGDWRVSHDPSYAGSRGVVRLDSTSHVVFTSGPLGGPMPVAPVPGDYLFKAFTLAWVSGGLQHGVTIDGVTFDGNAACNAFTHDWRLNDSLVIKGHNTVRGSSFYGSPAETMTVCGGTFTNNYAHDLAGSFAHKSCVPGTVEWDLFEGNLVERANQVGDAVMQHSEAVLTMSANAGRIFSVGNVYGGNESGIGWASAEDSWVYSVDDAFDVPWVLTTFQAVDLDLFQFARPVLVGSTQLLRQL